MAYIENRGAHLKRTEKYLTQSWPVSPNSQRPQQCPQMTRCLRTAVISSPHARWRRPCTSADTPWVVHIPHDAYMLDRRTSGAGCGEHGNEYGCLWHFRCAFRRRLLRYECVHKTTGPVSKWIQSFVIERHLWTRAQMVQGADGPPNFFTSASALLGT